MLTHRSTRLAVALAAALALALTACSSSSSDGDDSDSAPASDAFPVTIDHAFGSTEIDAKPERVAVWGFGSTDAALALGVVPVAIPEQEYGGDDEGLLPWIKEKLDDLGSDTPTMLPNGDEIPFEAIAEARPDVILATYSGITKADYDKLSKIAPTVAYPDQPWATPWRDVVTTTGTALGLEDQAKKLVTETDKTIEEAGAKHPELQGKTVAAVWDTGDTFYVYEKADPRVEFLTDLGLKSAPSVDALSTDESTFYFTLSTEKLDKLTSDVLVSYADTEDAQDAFEDQPYAQAMDQVKDDHVAEITGSDLIAAVSPPTVLSLTWGLDDVLDALSGAVD